MDDKKKQGDANEGGREGILEKTNTTINEEKKIEKGGMEEKKEKESEANGQIEKKEEKTGEATEKSREEGEKEAKEQVEKKETEKTTGMEHKKEGNEQINKEHLENAYPEKVHTIKNFFKSLGGKKKNFIAGILTLISFLIVLIIGINIRLKNLHLLKDVTTGHYIPLALDPFYFLRMARTMLNGSLPTYDPMRYPALHIGFTHEILPKVILFLYKFVHTFSKTATLGFADVIYPVVFFVLGIIVYFFFVKKLTTSKLVALLSSSFLTVMPMYLYRSMTGFSDHEPIGMLALFLTFLTWIYTLAFWKNNKFRKAMLMSALTAFFTALTMASWGGAVNYVFMILPLSFMFVWFVKVNDSETSKKLFFVYALWFVLIPLFIIMYGFSFHEAIGKMFFTKSSLLVPLMLLFSGVDVLLRKTKKKIKLTPSNSLNSLIISLIVGLILLGVMKGFGYVTNLLINLRIYLLHPFGLGRTGLTVAENAQPYLVNWFSQSTKLFFWLFFFGLSVVGYEAVKNMNLKYKVSLFFSWIILVSGMIFSRISSTSMLNGDNFLSQFIYFGSMLLFFVVVIWFYIKDSKNGSIEFKKINIFMLFALAWALVSIVSARGAVRLFFIITPFVTFSASLLTVNLFDYAKKNKDEIARIIFWVVFALVILGMTISFVDFTKSSTQQAKYTGPSANVQWQKAMAWTRNNTAQGSVFTHWWDYGYWVEYLGERISVTDGGHANGFWDHLVGRYLLTEPNPGAALSFMKSHNVSYLLIDPTDIGKYSAYSSIGSDKTGIDRLSWISTFNLNEKQTRETRNATVYVYTGGTLLDSDFVWQDQILPMRQAGIGAFILSIENGMLKQPQAIIVYRGQQIKFPVRYLWLDKLYDFGNFSNTTSIDGCLYIFPSVKNNKIKTLGSALWLSPKVMHSLFAQLYLFNDTLLPEYKNAFVLAHAEQDPIVEQIKQQNPNIKSDIINYYGLRGPIKIWKINYPKNIIARPEFLRKKGGWSEFDNLTFVNSTI